MRTHLATSAVLAALAMATAGATAQTANPSTPARADVKAEAARSSKAGEISRNEAPAKETFKPTQTREQRKAETRAAVARGEVTSRGDAYPEERPAKRTAPQESRPDVKKQAAAANKSGSNRGGETSAGQTR